MPSFPAVSLPQVFTLIEEYHVAADTTKVWRNSYDFYSASVPTFPNALTNAIASFATAMIWADSVLVQHRVYNWSRGTHVYPLGSPIWTSLLGVTGNAAAAWLFGSEQAAAGNEVCLRVDKAHTGAAKPGRFFFRNFIPESNIGANRGERWAFVSGTPITQGHLNSILSSLGVDPYLAGAPHSDGMALVTVQYSPKTHTVSGFQYDTGWNLIGPTVNKTGRKSHR